MTITPFTPAATRTVVATVLRHSGATALFRRSREVGSDAGLWHCITGYLEPGTTSTEQAQQELVEECGYSRAAAAALVPGPVLSLADRTGTHWAVHTFALDAATRDLALNWEHDDVRWIDLGIHHRLPCVPWLDHVLAAVA